jgi:hypothetical protein
MKVNSGEGTASRASGWHWAGEVERPSENRVACLVDSMERGRKSQVCRLELVSVD